MKGSILFALGAALVTSCSEQHGPLTAMKPAPPPAGAISMPPDEPGLLRYGGRATAVSITLRGNRTMFVDAGPLPEGGGAEQKSLVSASLSRVISASALHATTTGENAVVRSEASVGGLAITVDGNTIGADAVRARAEARHANGIADVRGSSEFTRLVINGSAVPVSGAPNQVVPIVGGRVILNEQTSDSSGDITVHALHLIDRGVAEIIISSAHAARRGSGRAVPFAGDHRPVLPWRSRY